MDDSTYDRTEQDVDVDVDEDFLFDSPTPSTTQNNPDVPSKPRAAGSRFSTDEAREAALKQELENIRDINKVVEGVVDSLEKAKANMETVSRTVNSASTLLQTWTRILSQTEHNQRRILDRNWQGTSQDLADLENDAARRQYDAQRRQAQEQERREAAARKAEEDERKRAAASARGTKGTRGRGTGRGGARPTSGASGSTTTSGYTRVGGYGGRGTGRASGTPGRAGTGIGRGRGTRGLG